MKKLKHIIEMFFPSKMILKGLKNASYLTFGHFITMLISFFGFIYIARILGPDDFGIYVTVAAFVGIFDILTFQGINKVILREGAKNLKDMGNYFENTIGIKILFTIIAVNVCIISAIFMPYQQTEKFYIIIYSLTLIYSSLFEYFGTIYKAAEKMQYNAVLNILNKILFVSLAITFLNMGFGILTLIIIALGTEFITLLINYNLGKKFLKFNFFTKIKWNKILLKSSLIFSIISFSVLLTTRVDLVMISWLSSLKDVGIYGVAFQITQSGVVVRNFMAIAFFPIFVRTFHTSIIRWNRLLKYAIMMGVSILLLSAIVSIFSNQIINLLFGIEYFESGLILSILIFWLAFSFFSIPFTNILQATHNETILLKILWIGPCLNIGLNYIFFNMFGLVGIAYSTLCVSIIDLSIYIYFTWITLKKQNRLF